MVLNLELPSSEEEEFSCLSIIVKFVRVNGKELCYIERILGSQNYAQANFSYIKDNYQYVSEGTWKQSLKNPKFETEVTYKRLDNKYTLTYLLKELK